MLCWNCYQFLEHGLLWFEGSQTFVLNAESVAIKALSVKDSFLGFCE